MSTNRQLYFSNFNDACLFYLLLLWLLNKRGKSENLWKKHSFLTNGNWSLQFSYVEIILSKYIPFLVCLPKLLKSGTCLWYHHSLWPLRHCWQLPQNGHKNGLSSSAIRNYPTNEYSRKSDRYLCMVEYYPVLKD